MHDVDDLFLTTAQIGMALAGFAGLVSLLGRERVPGNARLNEVSFRSMMELSLTLTIFALLPFVPQELGADRLGAIRIASALYAASVLTFLVRSARRNRALLGRVLIQGPVSAALYTVASLVGALLALDALAPPEIAPGLYFTALFVHFAGAAFFFIRLLYGSLTPIP